MIRPNKIYEKDFTVHGFAIPAAVSGISCLLLFLALIFGLKLDMGIALAIDLPFAIFATYIGSSKNYKSFVINLITHPYYIYSQPERIKRL
jgi:hypothetical protein